MGNDSATEGMHGSGHAIARQILLALHPDYRHNGGKVATTRSTFAIVWIVVSGWLATGTAYPQQAKPTPSASPLPPVRSEAESWVIEQVQAGKEADLAQHFPTDEGKRMLGGRFLEELVTDGLPGVKPRRFGIHVSGAVFNDPIALDNAQINYPLWLNHCQFNAAFSAVRAAFVSTIQFDNSTFAADADFNSAKVGATAFFRNTVFNAAANFGSADIGGQFLANGVQFRSQKETAVFGSIRVAATAFFNHAVFAGPVLFVSANIGSQLLVNSAQFQNPKADVVFNGMKVVDIASFNATVFAGPVDFGTSFIGGQFTLAGARFGNPDATANFNGARMNQTAYFTRAVFAGAVDFGSATVGDQFLAENARFQNPTKTVNFNGLKVASLVVISNAVFSGPVNFTGATINNQFQANGTQFLSHDQIARFNGMKVADIASFMLAVFAGPVDLADGTFLDLIMSQSVPDAAAVPRLDLSRTLVRRKLSISQFHAQDFVAESLRVEGSAYLTSLRVEQSADLRFSDFVTLDLTGSQWPSKASRKLMLQGMHYRSIRAAADDAESHEKLLGLIDQAKYSADIYGTLEAFFVHQGYTDDADDAYVAGRVRERRETMSALSVGYYANLLLQTVGYGRHPERAILACALVVALGCWVFKPAKMVPQTVAESSEPRQYNRFWYSLELFLPIVELKSVDAWEPKSEFRFLRHYMRIHVLLGWILVPIALAAQSGLIK